MIFADVNINLAVLNERPSVLHQLCDATVICAEFFKADSMLDSRGRLRDSAISASLREHHLF